jgi:F-type H+-transporting ATPase subunit delta
MAELTTIARPYARALFEYALAHKSVDAWHHILEEIEIIINNSDMQLFLDHPNTKVADVVTCILNLMKNQPNISKQELENWLNVLVKNNRISLASHIAKLFNQLQLQQESKVEVKLVASAELELTTIKNIEKNLEDKLQMKPEITATHNKALLGGIIIKTGDTVLDGSVRARLKQLKHHMMSA